MSGDRRGRAHPGSAFFSGSNLGKGKVDDLIRKEVLLKLNFEIPKH